MHYTKHRGKDKNLKRFCQTKLPYKSKNDNLNQEKNGDFLVDKNEMRMLIDNIAHIFNLIFFLNAREIEFLSGSLANIVTFFKLKVDIYKRCGHCFRNKTDIIVDQNLLNKVFQPEI